MPTETHTSYAKTTRKFNYQSSGSQFGPPVPPTQGETTANESTAVGKTKTGVSVANWKRLIKECQNATSGFSASEETYSYGSGGASVKHQFQAGGNTWNYNLLGGWSRCKRPVSPDSLTTSVAYTNARIAFLGEVNKAQIAFQGGVFLGELAETLRLIRSPAKLFQGGLHNYLNRVKRMARRGGKKAALREASNRWLEFQFGWRQLYNDTVDSAKALSRLTQDPWIKRCSAQGNDRGMQVVDGIAIQQSPFNYLTEDRVELKVECEIVGGVKINNSGGGAMRQFGIFPGNFVPTLWELIPYSFVVDYFTNVGEMINAAAANTGSIAWNSMTMRKVAKATNLVTADLMLTPVGAKELYRSRYFSSAIRERKSIVRSSVYDWDFNPFEAFSVGTPGSSTKWINLAALIGAGRSTSRMVSQAG